MTQIRIAIICFEGPHEVKGGVQRRISEEVAYLSKNEVNLTIIYCGRGKSTSHHNIQYIPVPVPKIIYPIETLLFSIKVAYLLAQLPRFDIVETHHDAGIALLLLLPFAKKPYKVWCQVIHGVYLDEFNSIFRYESLFSKSVIRASALVPLSLIERLAACYSTAVITVSNYSSKKIQQFYRVPKSKIYIIPNGIDTQCFHPNNRAEIPINELKQNLKQVFLYVGRLDPRKGVLVLLRAFAKARMQCPNIELEIIGSGLQLNQISDECKRLTISDVVHLRGNKTDQEIAEAYRSAYTVCVPSFQEGQGIVALEAQACGTPVIATCAGGLIENVQDQVTGLLVPPGDDDRLAEAIITLISNVALQRTLGLNASEWTKSFKWASLISKQLELYEKLLSSI